MELTRGRKILLVVGGTFVGVLIFLAAAPYWYPGARDITEEDLLGLRKVLDATPECLFQYDPLLSYVCKTNFIGVREGVSNAPHRTNSLGLLGTNEVHDCPPGQRVLLLGDSVLYGHGLPFEDTITARLNAAARGTCTFFAATCPGWSFHQESLCYTAYLRTLQWTRVVFVVCLNDVLKFEWVYHHRSGYRMSPSHSLITRGKGAALINAMRISLALQYATRPLTEHNNTVLYAWIPEHWERFADETLVPFLHTIASNRVAIVVVPTQYQLEALQRGADSEVVLYPQHQWARYCAAHGVPFHDAVAAFDPAGAPGRWYHDGMHLSPEGHARMAAYLLPLTADVLATTGH